VTVLPASTDEPNVSCTTELLIAILLTSKGKPLTLTVYAETGAVVTFSVSSYESDNTSPVLFTEADSSVGATESPGSVELFVTATFENANASFPSAS
jgi:hypothetical protein